MTLSDISYFFESDTRLLWYFDPESKASNNKEAIEEIYNKLVSHCIERDCKFKRNDIGYVFYSDGLLISFCLKPEYRTRENIIKFGRFIRSELGDHFKCYLYNRNTRAINFLEKIGMKKTDSNHIITLLCL